MKNKLISLLLAAAMLLGLLAGCGNASAPETTAPAPQMEALDLEELYNKQVQMEQLQAFGKAHTDVQPDNQEADACD